MTKSTTSDENEIDKMFMLLFVCDRRAWRGIADVKRFMARSVRSINISNERGITSIKSIFRTACRGHRPECVPRRAVVCFTYPPVRCDLFCKSEFLFCYVEGSVILLRVQQKVSIDVLTYRNTKIVRSFSARSARSDCSTILFIFPLELYQSDNPAFLLERKDKKPLLHHFTIAPRTSNIVADFGTQKW